MRPLLALFAIGVAAYAQSMTPVQMPEGVRVRDAAYADLDGDGLRDLVVSTNGPALELRIHLQKTGDRPFVARPDAVLSPVWKDVVSFAVADVHPGAGSEVVLFTGKGTWAWRPWAEEKERAVKLGDCDFLWQLPFPWGPLHWDHAVQDLDGDGRADLVLPEPDGYCIGLQREPGKFDGPQELLIPAMSATGVVTGFVSDRRSIRKLRERFALKLTTGGTLRLDTLRSDDSLVDVADRIPAPHFSDWDADGDLDCFVQTRRWIHVWRQDENGRFDRVPPLNFRSPVEADPARRLEVSFSAHVLDFDLDRRADCVFFSGDQRSDDVRTQVQFFRQADGKPLFREDGMPDQLLVLSGFAGNPRFDDVDWDGYPDLMVGALRPDLLDSLKGSGKSSLDVELYVYRNRRGTFSRRPDLVHRTEVQAEGLRPGRKGIMARFFGDVDGDGLSDLLLRDRAGRILVLRTRPGRRGWSIHSRPLMELSIDPDSWIVVGPPRGPRKAPDVIVLEDEQILFVRFP